MSAGVYNLVLGVGYLVAPLYGSSINESLGFRLTMDITAFFDLAFAIAYFVCADGLSAFTNTYKNWKGAGETSKVPTQL